MKWVILALVLLSGCVTGWTVPEEQGSVGVLFCDKVNCSSALERSFRGPSCAFYNAGEALLEWLREANARLVVDGDHPVSGAVVERGWGLMHNKFCVSGSRVWTGSWNPAQRMSVPNNVVIIESPTIASAFSAEFDELSSGVFHGGKPGPSKVLLSGNLVEAYFCPEDKCQKQVLRVLSSAEDSIYFMTFSFTDDEIGDLLVEKRSEGVEVSGVFDPRQGKYSEYEKLKEVSVVKSVHHKVFIVDESVVITGSYNPSKNGNTRNDENVVIIHNAVVAREFLEEFERFI